MYCISVVKSRKLLRHFLLLLCLFIVAGCIPRASYAQQANNWYFGSRAGLTFNTDPPSILLDGAMFTSEGCATISDNNGRILFYTDGVSVWNKLHQVMPNGTGLKGHPSSSNSAIIIPKPGSDKIYYIFTASAVEDNSFGYYYSELDMSLRGGLGDITATKNVLLYELNSEKLTAARHSNGVDVWVITKTADNTQWKVYKIDCNGLNTVPVISDGGPAQFVYPFVNVGCVKVSPDGTKVADANTGESQWELFKFDAATGKLTDGLFIPTKDWPFGFEFSPDSKTAYVGFERFTSPDFIGSVLQYSLDVYDEAFIKSTETLISNSTSPVGALQLGPDNKIYCAAEFSDKLSVINAPNVRGMACGFVNNHINLQGRTAMRGLPVFFGSLITHKNADFDYIITGDCATVNFSGNTTITGNVTWQWDFGDGSTGTGQNIAHRYPAGRATDTVQLTVTSTGSCGSAVAVKIITLKRVVPTPRFDVAKQCGNLSVKFNDSSLTTGSPIQNWLWDFGDGTTSDQQFPIHIFAGFGNYTVKLSIGTPGGCNELTTIQKNIVVEAKPGADFINTKSCAGEPVSFTDRSSIASGNITQWKWDFGDGTTSPLQHPQKSFTAGNHNVKLIVTSPIGCGPDTIIKQIAVEAFPVVAFDNTGACIERQIQFTNKTALSFGTITGYAWDFGEGTVSDLADPVHSYNRYGNYTTMLKAFTANGCTAIASKVFHIAPAVAFAGNDTTVATGQPLQLAATGGVQYQWSPKDFLNEDNIFNPVAVLQKDQRYQVKVTTADGCVGFDEIYVHVIKGPDIYVPNAFTPEGRNRVFRPVMSGIKELYFFTVYNRWGQQVFTTRENGKGWDGKINGVIQPGGVFVWAVQAKDYAGRVITKKGSVLLVR